MMDPTSAWPIFAIVTAIATWLVSFAYRNTKHLLKHKIAVKRESAVSKVRANFQMSDMIYFIEDVTWKFLVYD